jgi:predicted RNA-binding protein
MNVYVHKEIHLTGGIVKVKTKETVKMRDIFGYQQKGGKRESGKTRGKIKDMWKQRERERS